MSLHENLFTYGTLMDASLLRAVTGRQFQGEPATLPGYRCALLKRAPYPGVMECPGSDVAGILYRGLDNRSLKRLDRYEGRLYRRRRLLVQVADGPDSAFVYVIPASRRRRLRGRIRGQGAA